MSNKWLGSAALVVSLCGYPLRAGLLSGSGGASDDARFITESLESLQINLGSGTPGYSAKESASEWPVVNTTSFVDEIQPGVVGFRRSDWVPEEPTAADSLIAPLAVALSVGAIRLLYRSRWYYEFWHRVYDDPLEY